MNVIEVEAVTKKYGDVVAVNGVSLSVDRGECMALLGPNGAGKTVATEMMEGFRRPDSGTVRVLGRDPRRGGVEWKARIGIVLQSTRDLEDLTVRESVGHFASYFPGARPVDEVIGLVGLRSQSERRNSTLSGGQRRRLDVALGIVGRPELLFLDEPTTGFDPEARHDFWDMIDALKAEGTTIFLTSHYLEEAERLADRVAVMSRGRVIACAPPSEIGGSRAATVRWREHGQLRSVQTDTPTRLVKVLTDRLRGEVPELSITRPSLEDRYLALVDTDR